MSFTKWSPISAILDKLHRRLGPIVSAQGSGRGCQKRSVAVGTVAPGKRQEQRERFEKLRHLVANMALGVAHGSIVGGSIELTLERFRRELAVLEPGVSGLHVRLVAQHRHLRVRIAKAQE